jgi:hypothetical protein
MILVTGEVFHCESQRGDDLNYGLKIMRNEFAVRGLFANPSFLIIPLS